MNWKSWLPTSVIRAKVVTVMKSRSSVLYPFDIENSITFTPEFWSTIWVLCASLVAQMVKNLPTLQETWVQSLGWEDPLEKWMPTHSNILAWRIPWTKEPGGLQSLASQRVRHNWATKWAHTCTHTHTPTPTPTHTHTQVWVLYLSPNLFQLL